MKHFFKLAALVAALFIALTGCKKDPEEVRVSSVKISPLNMSLTVGETGRFSVEVLPSTAADKSVRWMSSDSDVVSVSQDGSVSALKAGEATVTVTAKDGGKSASAKVNVSIHTISVTSIALDRESAELVKGESVTLVATVLPEDATDKSVQWSSSAASVASVSEDGKVTAVAVGTADITAKAGEASAVCKITVKEPEYIANERQALIAIYNACGGSKWQNARNWCTDKPVSQWYGVEVDSESGRVTRLRIADSNLIGTIPAEIADLEMLESLDLSNNYTESETGFPLPKEIGKLKNLKHLGLVLPIIGTVPEEYFSLTGLEFLRINSTYHTGMTSQTMPDAIGDMVNLKTAAFGYVNFSGSIPSSIGRLVNLESFVCFGGNLTGTLPKEMAALDKLTELDLSTNKLSGPMPVELSEMEWWWRNWTGVVTGNQITLQDIVDSRIPAPKSTPIKCLDGNEIDLDKVFSSNKYTLLMNYSVGNSDALGFLTEFASFYKENRSKGLEAIIYCDSNSSDYKKQHAEFKSLLASVGAEFKSFTSYMYEEGQREFYTEYGRTMYPGGVENALVIIGPDKTVEYANHNNSTILGLKNGLTEVIPFLSEKLDIAQEERYESSDYSSDGKVEILRKASKGSGIDLVITGDAFSDRLIADGTFKAMAEDAANAIFSSDPLNSLKDRFNIHIVNAVSKNEEYFDGSSTVYSGVFGSGTACGGDHETVLQYARKAVPDDKMDNTVVLVLMNSFKNSGTAYMFDPEKTEGFGEGTSIVYVPYKTYASGGTLTDNLYGTLIHEVVGHGIAKLQDEYAYTEQGRITDDDIRYLDRISGYGWAKNVDYVGDKAKVKWSKFLTDSRYSSEGLGVFEGAFTFIYGAYRPTEKSIMRSHYETMEFNAPSREAIWIRVMRQSEGSAWTPDYESFVKWDKSRAAAPAANPATRSAGASENTSTPPVLVRKTWRQVAR